MGGGREGKGGEGRGRGGEGEGDEEPSGTTEQFHSNKIYSAELAVSVGNSPQIA